MIHKYYPKLADFIDNYVTNRFETEEGDLFELLWRFSQDWTNSGAGNSAGQTLADELAALASDDNFSPEILEKLFNPSVPPESRLIISAHARTTIKLIADHFLYTLSYPAGNPKDCDLKIILNSLDDKNDSVDAEKALISIYSCLTDSNNSDRHIIMKKLFQRVKSEKLNTHPWLYEKEPVWSECNSVAFARAVTGYAYTVYLYAPVLNNGKVAVDFSLVGQLDINALQKAIDALHFTRFCHPLFKNPVVNDEKTAVQYNQVIDFLQLIYDEKGKCTEGQKIKRNFFFQSPDDWNGKPGKDAVEFALRYIEQYSLWPEMKSSERINTIRSLIFPFTASNTMLSELALMADKHRWKQCRK